jgi:hypothetical protein
MNQINEYLDNLQESDLLTERNKLSAKDILQIVISSFGGALTGAGAFNYLDARTKDIQQMGGALAIAGIIIFAVNYYFLLKRKKIERLCMTYPNKEECKKKLRQDTLKKEIAGLIKNKHICDKSSNPAKCKARIDDRIKKVQSKIKR